MLLHTMDFAAMRAHAGNSRWPCFDVEFELQLLQVEFMEAGEIHDASHCFRHKNPPKPKIRRVEIDAIFYRKPRRGRDAAFEIA